MKTETELEGYEIVTLYLLTKRIELTQSQWNKWMFLINYHSKLQFMEFTVFGLWGPVPIDYNEKIRRMKYLNLITMTSNNIIKFKIHDESNIYNLMSLADMKIIDEILDKYRDKSNEDIVNMIQVSYFPSSCIDSGIINMEKIRKYKIDSKASNCKTVECSMDTIINNL